MSVYAYKYMYVWVYVCIYVCCVLAFSGPDEHCESGQLWSPWVSSGGGGRPSHLMRSAGDLSPWDWEWSGILCRLVAFGSPMLLLGTPWAHWLTTDLDGILPLVHTCSVFPSISPVKVTWHCVCVCVRTRRTDLWQVVCIIRRPATWWELRYLCPSP